MSQPNPTPSAPKSPSKSQEYLHDNQPWLVTDFALMQDYIKELAPDQLPGLHAFSQQHPEHARYWAVLARLCGIRPLIPPLDANLADYGPMSEDEVSLALNLNPVEVNSSAFMLYLAWRHHLQSEDQPSPLAVEKKKKKKEPPAPSAAPAQTQATPSSGEKPVITLTDEEAELLELGTFPTAIFHYQKTDADRRAEILWFTGRIAEVRKVFEEPMTKTLARQALLNELQLRRIDERLVLLDPAGREFGDLQETKTEVEKNYSAQWQQIETLCPGAVASAHRRTTIQNLSDLVTLYQQFKSDPANFQRDGIFTDEEIQILFRRSVQLPDVPYRMGWVLACNEAKLGLADPRFKRRMTDPQCKVLDTAFAYAAGKLMDKMRMPKPDLEADGPEGEYPPIHREATGEIAQVDLAEVDATDPTPSEQVEIEEPVAPAAQP